MAQNTQATPAMGRLHRWRLTEPLRFYSWPAIVILTVGMPLTDLVAIEWLRIVLLFALVAGVALANEAARRSVYTLPGALKAVRDLPAELAGALDRR